MIVWCTHIFRFTVADYFHLKTTFLSIIKQEVKKVKKMNTFDRTAAVWMRGAHDFRSEGRNFVHFDTL